MKRRPQKTPRNYRFFLITVAGILFIAVVTVTIIYAERRITVREIIVLGARNQKPEDIIALTGVRTGDRLFALSGRETIRRLKKSPWIRDAAVRKDLSGRLTLKIAEAVPAAILKLDGAPYLVAAEGTILERMSEAGSMLLPVIVDVNPSEHGHAYDEMLKLAVVLTERKVVSNTGPIELRGMRPEDITMTIDGLQVLIGMGEYEKKLERLRFVREEIQKRRIAVQHIDLRFLRQAIVRPSGESTGQGKSADAKRRQ